MNEEAASSTERWRLAKERTRASRLAFTGRRDPEARDVTGWMRRVPRDAPPVGEDERSVTA